MIMLTSSTFQSLFFHLIISSTMISVDILSQICPLIALVGVLIAFYSTTYRSSTSRQTQVSHSDLLIYITMISFALIVFNPRLMTDTIALIFVYGLLWMPQILVNIFEHPSWRFHYRLSFVLIQSCHFIFPPLYARGFHNNFLFLKPDPKPVQALIVSYCLQLCIM